MIRRAMRYMTSEALQRAADEPRLVSCFYVRGDGCRCLWGAAADMRSGDMIGKLYAPWIGGEWPPFMKFNRHPGGRFEAVATRIGQPQASRLCQEAALKELHRRAIVVHPEPVHA